MFELLDHRSEEVASQIHALFRRSYTVEARLIGAEDFPPLRRSAQQIRSSSGAFLGAREGSDLVAAVEYAVDGPHLDIRNLAVDPRCFRQGRGTRLLQALLERTDWRTATVETAAGNLPAVALYEKIGFSVSGRWTTAEGIEKIGLSLGRS
ncbi:GNAT family N-acetyltransferase [Lentisalinibacter orientalis]|uniref:GNAT family N-acetyltransferase n=1 Tax=Lentisalinibacter orientalis TaxID=2992241 RepID=UPI0038699A51